MASSTLFWFRRDLRLHDNAGLFHALKERGENVLPIFIFDTGILGKLEDPADARVTFIYQAVEKLKIQLQKKKSDLLVRHGKPLEVFKKNSLKKNKSRLYMPITIMNRQLESAMSKWQRGRENLELNLKHSKIKLFLKKRRL